MSEEKPKNGAETTGTGAGTGGSARMGPGIFLIAIMGCGDGDGACRTVRTLDTPYASRAACSVAADEAAARATDLDFPVIVAQCVAAGTKAAVRGGEVKLPAGGRASVRTSPIRS
jgi:hypothetical protein